MIGIPSDPGVITVGETVGLDGQTLVVLTERQHCSLSRIMTSKSWFPMCCRRIRSESTSTDLGRFVFAYFSDRLQMIFQVGETHTSVHIGLILLPSV